MGIETAFTIFNTKIGGKDIIDKLMRLIMAYKKAGTKSAGFFNQNTK